MKHADEFSLNQLEALLQELRTLPGIKERSRGVFYRRSKSFLHFHDDPAGLFADVRIGDEFQRFKVSYPIEKEALLESVRRELLG